MHEELDIRLACADDLPALRALYRHLILDEEPVELATGQDALASIAAIPGSGIYVGFVGREAVASCALFVLPNLTRRGMPFALIENVVTHADFRRLGFGRAVLRAAVSAAWEQGCYKVMLLTGARDGGVVDFYVEAGFQQSKTGFEQRRIAPRP
jgi:GNAT superfamily N-acetyltransferase